jgi:hypothetical protein
MRMFITAVMCAVVLAVLGLADAGAATKSKTKASKAADNPAADNTQCNEVTLIGVIEEKTKEVKDKDGKVQNVEKYYVLTDSKKKEWTIHPWNVAAAGVEKVKASLGVKVKLVGMVVGNSTSLVSVKKVEKK